MTIFEPLFTAGLFVWTAFALISARRANANTLRKLQFAEWVAEQDARRRYSCPVCEHRSAQLRQPTTTRKNETA